MIRKQFKATYIRMFFRLFLLIFSREKARSRTSIYYRSVDYSRIVIQISRLKSRQGDPSSIARLTQSHASQKWEKLSKKLNYKIINKYVYPRIIFSDQLEKKGRFAQIRLTIHPIYVCVAWYIANPRIINKNYIN